MPYWTGLFSGRRRVSWLGCAAVIGLLTGPATAQAQPEAATTGPDCQIQLSVANPDPGAVLVPLSVVINGTAVDLTATQGTGISQVQLYLGARESGGMFLGNAAFPMTNEIPGFWTFQANFPDSATGPAELFTYALSEMSGQEASVGVPILINEDISQTGMEMMPSTPDIFCPSKLPPLPVAASSEMPIVNVEWQWTTSTDASGQSASIDDPTMYTLMLQPNGGVQVLADCNTSNGTFLQTETGLTIDLGPTTLAECPPGSLSNQYLSNLGSVSDFTISDEGNLVLMLGDSGGEMVFAPATGEVPVGEQIE